MIHFPEQVWTKSDKPELKITTMKLAFFIIAGLLAIAWILGYFIFNAGAFVHFFVISAALSLMQGIIVTPKPQPIGD
jgi:hypothetical protein